MQMVVNVGDPAAVSRVTPAGDPGSWSPHGVIFFLPGGARGPRGPADAFKPPLAPSGAVGAKRPLGKGGPLDLMLAGGCPW